MSIHIEYQQNQDGFVIKGIGNSDMPFSVGCVCEIDNNTVDLWRQPGKNVAALSDGWEISHQGTRLNLYWRTVKNGVEIKLNLLNQSERYIALSSLTPASIRLEGIVDDPSHWRFYQHGFQSWTPSRPRKANERQAYPWLKSFALMNQNVDSPFYGRKDGLISHLFTLLKPVGADEGVFFGFTRQAKGLGEIFLKNKGETRLTGLLDYGGKGLAPGEEIESEPFLILEGDNDRLISDYMNQLSQNARARVPATVPVGWCSWYEFYTGVTQENIKANNRILEDHPELGVSFVQLDDGYQTAVGDWLSLNDKFPDGLEKIARDNKKNGFKAGIWLAPFFATKNSALFKNHPEWFLTSASGSFVDCGYNPSWNSRTVALDLTRPEVEDWLRKIFTTMVEAGFDYFKIDFIFAGIRHGQRYRGDLSPVESYRRGLEIIRVAIGERFLLGCGAPIGPTVGFVDGMRVSEDVKEKWRNPLMEALGRGCGVPSARGSLRNNIQRYYTHKKLWLNDPDCVLARDHKTRLTSNEVKTLVTLLGLTGGMLFLSDDLTKLNPERLEMVKAVLPPTPLTGVPEGGFDDEYPTVFKVVGEDASVFAHTNWENRQASVQLDALEYRNHHVFDFWRNDFNSKKTITLEKHETIALQLNPVRDAPHLAGTTFHLTGLADERIKQTYNRETGELSISGIDLARRQGHLWIAIPEGFSFLPDQYEEDYAEWSKGIHLVVEKPGTWEIRIPFKTNK